MNYGCYLMQGIRAHVQRKQFEVVRVQWRGASSCWKWPSEDGNTAVLKRWTSSECTQEMIPCTIKLPPPAWTTDSGWDESRFLNYLGQILTTTSQSHRKTCDASNVFFLNSMFSNLFVQFWWICTNIAVLLSNIELTELTQLFSETLWPASRAATVQSKR